MQAGSAGVTIELSETTDEQAIAVAVRPRRFRCHTHYSA